jgi:hypothetical protein
MKKTSYNNRQPIESIAIDDTFTRKSEQTYACIDDGILISIVNPRRSNFFKNRHVLNSFNSNFTPFSNNLREEWAISIFLKLDFNFTITNDFRVEKIRRWKQIDFNQAEKVFYNINDQTFDEHEWNRIREMILRMHEYATILKRDRLGHSLENLRLNGELENLNVWPIVHEFSLYANQKFGEYVYFQMGLIRFVPLVLTSTFKEEKGQRLNEFLSEETLLNKYSRFGTEKIHFANTNNLSLFNNPQLSLSSKDSICVNEAAYDYMIILIRNIIYANEKKKYHLANAWYEELTILALKEEFYPEFVYRKRIFVDTIQPIYGNYAFFERKNLNSNNNFFFHENLKYYTHVTQPCRNKINFYLVHLIFCHINNEQRSGDFRSIVDHMQREDCRNELIRETTNTKDNDKLSKKVEKSSRIFSKPVMHHSLAAKHSIQDEDLIVELTFPLSLNFYKIPINNRINFRKTFAKFRNYQQNEESVSFEMDVFLSDNQSNDQNSITLNSSIDTWKKKLSLEEFNQIRGFHNNMLNIDLMTQMASRNQSEILDVFTLNTHVLLSVKLNFKEAIILPCQYDCKEINDFIPYIQRTCSKN